MQYARCRIRKVLDQIGLELDEAFGEPTYQPPVFDLTTPMIAIPEAEVARDVHDFHGQYRECIELATPKHPEQDKKVVLSATVV